MDDVRKDDLRLFLKELTTPGRLLLYGVVALFGYLLLSSNNPPEMRIAITGGVISLLMAGTSAYTSSVKKRFRSQRMSALWDGCQDRMARFEDVLKKMRREQVADLREMPQTIRNVSGSIYVALRRADLIAFEVHQTEKGMLSQPPSWQAGANDPQSKELYRLADKNIAEYRSHFSAVMAGVQRTEAQSAVFMTTLDTLRMKMIGYRLVGRSPEIGSQDFLEALAEAKTQLNSIDQALDELDLGHYPKTISVVPPPMPEQERLRLEE